MMRMNNIKMTTTVDVQSLLDKLRYNLEKHSLIVKEAIAGYVDRAQKELLRRLEDLRSGKCVGLSFSLAPPSDHSECYRTTIKMLEWSKDATVVLQADEFRQLVLDEWDWTDNFLHSNSTYSKMARDEISNKSR